MGKALPVPFFLETEGYNNEGVADLVRLEVTSPHEVIASAASASGLVLLLGAMQCTFSGLAGGVARNKGSGQGIFKD